MTTSWVSSEKQELLNSLNLLKREGLEQLVMLQLAMYRLLQPIFSSTVYFVVGETRGIEGSCGGKKIFSIAMQL